MNQIRAKISRAKSAKENSQKELSNISEKFNLAKQNLVYARNIYQTILNGRNQLRETYHICVINNSNQLDFMVENLKKAER